jgi:hypothetical protein
MAKYRLGSKEAPFDQARGLLRRSFTRGKTVILAKEWFNNKFTFLYLLFFPSAAPACQRAGEQAG